MRHYTYLHLRSDTGEVFYVGKGVDKRMYDMKRGRNEGWRRVVAEAGLIAELAARWKTEGEALQHEAFLIETFRSLGYQLVNIASFGTSSTGIKRSDAWKEKQSTSMKRVWANPEWRRAHSARMLAGSMRAEVKARRAETMKASRAVAAASSRKAIEMWRRPDVRARICRPVECVTTGRVFESAASAGRELGISSHQISAVCSGTRKTTRGLQFKYAAEQALKQYQQGGEK